MATIKDLDRFFDRLDKDFLKRVVPSIVAEKATEFYKHRFTAKADVNNRSWPPAKHPPSRGSLMVRSGNLMASVRPSLINSKKVIISAGSSKVPYAQLHNEGGTNKITVTNKMRKFAWAMKYKTNADQWKYLAITKKTTISINIPKRQYMGTSQYLRNLLMDNIKMAYKQFFNSNKI